MCRLLVTKHRRFVVELLVAHVAGEVLREKPRRIVAPHVPPQVTQQFELLRAFLAVESLRRKI